MSEQQVIKSKYGILSGIGFILIGLAAVIFALAFSDKKFTSDIKIPDFPEHSPGYSIVTVGDKIFLLNKKTGEVWERKDFPAAWCAQYVQGIGKRSSPYTETTCR